LDQHTSTDSVNSALRVEYPTDRAFMSSIETAFEERVQQIASSAKPKTSSSSTDSESSSTLLAECSPFDQALASVLLMNDGSSLKGTVCRRLQIVCETLELLMVRCRQEQKKGRKRIGRICHGLNVVVFFYFPLLSQ
jgi:hypothetical protein